MTRSEPAFPDPDVGRAETAARKAFARLGLHHPMHAPIEAQAYELNAVVRYGPLTGAIGRVVRLRRWGIISVAASVTYGPRRRWTVAHELGHFFLHGARNQLQLCHEADVSGLHDRGAEREANAFASEYLMPRSLWERRVRVPEPNLEVVSALAEEFDVSLQAAALRFVKLSRERCAVVFAQDGCIQWWSQSQTFGRWIHRGGKVRPETLASDFFERAAEPRRGEAVPAGAWFSGRSKQSGERVIEDCLVLPVMKGTLSLLWIPGDRHVREIDGASPTPI